MRQALGGVLALLGVCSSGAMGQTSGDPDWVAGYVTTEMRKQRIPGLALLVARRGEIVRAEGFGFANVEHEVPVKPETVFQSGSVGKQFTAAAVMMLVEEGKLGLDDPITEYLEDAPPSWKAITMRRLLSHTGGFPDYPEDFDYQQDQDNEEAHEQALLRLARTLPLTSTPGTRWEYSNLGYAVAGIVIRRVSGLFYGDLLDRRIFRPLGMRSARIISEADIVSHRAAGYRLNAGRLKNQEWVSPMVNTTADGALYFSILDLARWDAALRTERLLKRSTLEEMWAPVRLANGEPNPEGYGLGWVAEASHGQRVVRHAGQWQGFSSSIVRFPEDGLTVALLANLDEPDLDAMADRIAEHYLSQAGSGRSTAR
jgi:CubicO group peptidase (beta-lactamase class C family)